MNTNDSRLAYLQYCSLWSDANTSYQSYERLYRWCCCILAMWCWAPCWSVLVLRLTSVSAWRIKKISRETCWGLLECPWEEQGSPWRSTELKTCHKVNPETGCFLFNGFNLLRRHTLVDFLLFCCLQWMMLSWTEWGRSSGLTATERTWWTRWWRSTSQAKQCV